MRIRATLVAVLSVLLMMGLAPAATAAPAPAPVSVTTAAPADLWISKQAMRMAWADLSYYDKSDVCDVFSVSPSYVVARLARSQSGLASWERRALRVWLRSFLYRKCAAFA